MKKKLIMALLAANYLFSINPALAVKNNKALYFVNSTEHSIRFKLAERDNQSDIEGTIHTIFLNPHQPYIHYLTKDYTVMTELTYNGYQRTLPRSFYEFRRSTEQDPRGSTGVYSFKIDSSLTVPPIYSIRFFPEKFFRFCWADEKKEFFLKKALEYIKSAAKRVINDNTLYFVNSTEHSISFKLTEPINDNQSDKEVTTYTIFLNPHQPYAHYLTGGYGVMTKITHNGPYHKFERQCQCECECKCEALDIFPHGRGPDNKNVLNFKVNSFGVGGVAGDRKGLISSTLESKKFYVEKAREYIKSTNNMFLKNSFYDINIKTFH